MSLGLDPEAHYLYTALTMEKRLITSALPYVNNIPHLGNIIQVLSADVFSRYCRLRGFETLYICGTDEYGTATETRALEEKITPRELCDRYYKIHDEIYKWFNIAFDKFGRTSTPEQTEITQSIFLKLDEHGYIVEQPLQQLFCNSCSRFLADRFVLGTCPVCDYEEARGDQCENCGKLLDPVELKNPRCSTCGETPVIRDTKHLYIDLPAIRPVLEKWIKEASVKGFWANNAIRMTEAWIRDGLKTRCITRDLKWGIPVPKEGYRDKVFYVWFDAPIGYISITATLTRDWKSWWMNPEEVKLYQFIGKDNIPFHTVIFPSSLLGSGEKWTMLYHMSSTEYLNYENTKFSKSKGIGVFGTDAKETGIPADLWRFYIYYNRPEKSDAQFMWKDFQEKINSELIGNLSNLVNRTLTFIYRNFKGSVPDGKRDEPFWQIIKAEEKKIEEAMEAVEIRDAFRLIFALSSIGNKKFQDAEPWRTIRENPPEAASLLFNLMYLIKDLAILVSPFIPATAQTIASFLGLSDLKWTELGKTTGITAINNPTLLFKVLEDKQMEALKARFSGSQKERESAAARFRKNICLKVAKITDIKRHPEAEKLYIETINLGNEERTIVSGLVPYYKEEELLGKNIIVAANLKPARLRGVDSNGMLLAAETGKKVEVIFAENAAPGDQVYLEGDEAPGATVKEYPQVTIEEFFDVQITVKDHKLLVEGLPLFCREKPVTTIEVADGKVR